MPKPFESGKWYRSDYNGKHRRSPSCYPNTLSPLTPTVASQASFSVSIKRLPKSKIRARVPPEIIWLNGLKGLKASAGVLRLHLTNTTPLRLTGKPRGVWRRYSIQVAVRRNGQSWQSWCDKGTRRNRRQFVVLFDVVIIEVAEYLHLIATDLVAKGRITTPSFLFRVGTCEQVEVKARQ